MEDNQKKPKSAKAKAQSKEKEILDVQIVEAKDITVEDVISTEIKKFNLADIKIAELKEQFKDLEISGVEDKNGYKAVSELFCIPKILKNESNSQHSCNPFHYLDCCFVSQRY